MSGSSQQQNTFKESADVCETRHNERRNISPPSSAYNGVVITIDDTPPGSPIRENSQGVEVAVSSDDEAISIRQPVAHQIVTDGSYSSPSCNHNTDRSSDYRAANRARFSCRSPSLCRYPIRSPPPPYNPSPLLYIDHVHRSIVTQVDQFPQSPVAEADRLLHLGIEAYHHPYDTFGQVTPLNLDIHRDYY
ncbi:hypothetical protein INT47_002454 [Mucor saturninus]|uniref:Uncharacterized protein n=1 Tax=Mucor saturninus TaxID=64648 RepID=A0A8H7RGE6_9FUNG|nr:hypothetical protein INT47_002454 [Mucor saturninus]